jgi:hypothetical protein
VGADAAHVGSDEDAAGGELLDPRSRSDHRQARAGRVLVVMDDVRGELSRTDKDTLDERDEVQVFGSRLNVEQLSDLRPEKSPKIFGRSASLLGR